VRVQFPLGAWGAVSGLTVRRVFLDGGAGGLRGTPVPRGKSTGRIRSPPRKRVRGKLRCGFESHGFRCQRGCVADPSWNSSRAHGPRGRHRPGVPEIRVRFPVSPLQRGWLSTVPWFSGDNTRVTTGKRWFESIRDHSPLPRKGWGGKLPPDNGVSPVGRTQEGHRPSSHCRWAGAQLAFIRPAGPVRARDLQLGRPGNGRKRREKCGRPAGRETW
jgi:hypothetical protein